MASFYFTYGTMNSGKSFEVLKVAHNYEEQGRKVVLLTSALDSRHGVGKITSRALKESRDAIPVGKETNIYKMVNEMERGISAILVDEAQFLNKEHVEQLANIVDLLKIPVMAFGLKNDFSNQLFEGSEALLLYADKLVEIKTICKFCERKATMNLRVNEYEEPMREGEQVVMGGNDMYMAVCRKHYNYPLLESEIEFDEEE